MSSSLPIFVALLFAFALGGCGDEEEQGAVPVRGESLQRAWAGTFAEREATFVEVTDGNVTIVRFRENNKLFTGMMTSHGPEGEQRISRFREGKKNGLCVIRDKSGGRTESNYRDGLEHGVFVIFGRDGVERFRWRYENGKKIRE